MVEKKNKDKLTVLIDKEIKDKYKKICEEKGMIIGKQIELFMERQIKDLMRTKKSGKDDN